MNTVNLTSPANPYCIAQGFLNGDTNVDLVTANYGANTITIWLGDGTGNFEATTNIACGGGPLSVAIGDFNGDSMDDLAVANYGAGTISILLGDETGNFQLVSILPRDSAVHFSLVVMDLNHDNNLDIACPNYGV